MALEEISHRHVQPLDWPQWGGWTSRNNTPQGTHIPIKFSAEEKENLPLERAKLGSQSYGNPVVANGKVYVGTNNGAGWIKRYPAPSTWAACCASTRRRQIPLAALQREAAQGRVNDWPSKASAARPIVEGDRLWFVTSRGEVVCLDTEGFYDGENDGPYTAEANDNKDEADVIWGST